MIEITKPSVTDPDRIFELEMHSVLNILNVINAQLQLISMMTKQPERLEEPIHLTKNLGDAIHKGDRENMNPDSLKELKKSVQNTLNRLEQDIPNLRKNPDYLDYKLIFDQIFRVLDMRLEELERRWEDPDRWEVIVPSDYKKELVHFLGVIEQNSSGRYRIVYNIAEQEERDYLVHIEIDSRPSGRIAIPLLLKDSIRDLIANARKYTKPGGKIDIGLLEEDGIIHFVVEDTGRGIPEDEIDKVTEYRYRATNVMEEVRTMGAGMGLTKAHYVIDRFGGRLWIDSELGKGTTVKFEVPIPASELELL